MSDSRNGPVRRIPVPGVKDDSGAFVPEKVDLSIDALLHDGLRSIHGVMKACLKEASTGHPSRESVQNLKDAMAMLHDLKEKEDALLEALSEEQLEKEAAKAE